MASFVVLLFFVGSVIGKFERGRYIACYDREDHGASYKGVENKAEDGRPCVNWGQAMSVGAVKLWKVPARQNYCRNPNGNKGLWCYTAKKQIQPCSAPACNGVPIKISPDAVNSSQADVTGSDRILSAGKALLLSDQLIVERSWLMCFWSRIKDTLVWWKADLKSVYLVKSVGFYSTSSGRNYNGLQIHVGNDRNAEKQCGKTFAHAGTSFNDTVYLDCGNGIHGRYVTISRSNELVICEIQINVDKKKCSNVSSHPSFLVVSKEGDGRVGSLLKYTCNSSCHQIIGNKHRECVQSEGESSAVWSGEEPTCQIVSCQDAPSVNNAVVDYRRKTCGGIATYSCDQGFILDGDSILNCSSNGTWTGTLPVCKGVQCKISTLSDRVVVNSTEYSYPNVINFSCMSRRHAVALTTELSVIKCQSNGNWSHPIPDCRRPFCELQKNVKNGKMRFDNNTRRRIYADQTAQFSCDSGYKLNGSRAIMCAQVNDEYKATFNASVPTCEAVTCKHLKGLFTLVNSKGNTYKNIANYKCRNGYHPQSLQRFKCESDGQWKPINELILCSPVACPELSIPDHGFVEGNYTFGYNVSFHCYYGYKLQGDEVSQCQADGTWSASLPPSCIEISCGSPRKIENGEVEPSINETVNSTAIYSCRENHEIHGNKSVKCEVNQEGEGEWEEPPVCKPVNCGHPGNVTNGELQGDSYDYFAVVRYSCHKGYEVASGDMSRTCQSNGNWSGRPLTCQRVKCRKPNNPLFGYHKLLLDSEPMSKLANESMYTFQQNVSFHCFYGFKLQGNTLSQCQANGTWSPALPVNCAEISCGFPSKIDNGDVAPSINGTANSTANYSCHENYEIYGNKTVKCEVNQEGEGEWEEPPVCKPVNCGHPGNVTNGQLQGDSYVYSAVVNYTCNKGYESVSGDRNRRCQGNGNWSGSPLTCQRVKCRKPNNPLFGYYTLLLDSEPMSKLANKSMYTFQQNVSFHCFYGFKLQGNKLSQCQANGTWFPALPLNCAEISCGLPRKIDNGEVAPSINGTVNSTANYSCHVNYELHGNETVKCEVNMEEGEWEESPVCKPVNCSHPGHILNGMLQGNSYVYPAVVNYTCNKGHESVSGDRNRTCQGNGNWSGSPLTCQRVKCGKPKDPLFGYHKQLSNSASTRTLANGSFYTFQQNVSFHCFHGYKLQGSTFSQCQANGTWSPALPLNCTSIRCGFPPKIDKGKVEPSINGTVNSTAVYSCHENHELHGSGTVKCLLNKEGEGEWEKPPMCQPVSCGHPGNIQNGKFQGNSFVYPAVVHYSCNEGYEAVSGDGNRTCQGNRNWSGKLLTCRRVICGKPTDPLFGYHQLLSNDYDFESRMRFICYLGYELKGEAVVSCNSSGKWHPNISTCTVLHCPMLVNNTLRRVRVLGREVNDTAIYTCINGYELLGSSRRTCSIKDGKTFWTPQLPRCTPKKCPKPSSLSNGKIIGDDYFYEKRIVFQCNEGYFLSGGSNAWYCNENGEWQNQNKFTGDFPRCEAVDCGTPSVPEYGVFEGKNHKFGGVVTYACNHGFKREGAARAQCMANGRWSASSPNCTRLTCSFLKPPKNGHFIQGGNTVGSTVKFSCNPGYDIKVADERLDPGIEEFVVKCKQFDSQHLASSAWTGPTRRFSSGLLVCQAKDCGTLPNIQLAKISYEPSTLFGSKARYGCIGEYETKEGNSVRFCRPNGKWNGTEPYCQHICSNVECPPFQICHVVNNKAACKCSPRDKCNSDYDPKCGDDGRTYNNECLMKVSGCNSGNPDIKVVRDGECKYSGVCLTDKPSAPEENPCRGFFPRYYFDFNTGTCKKYLFGGCFKGHNSFISEEDCKRTCQADPCGLPLHHGLCRGQETRWYYNMESGKCRKFLYSGCSGNENNFVSELRCVEKCVNQTVPTQQAVTSPPPAPKCCKIKKNRKKLCSENQFVVFAKILNVTKNKEGLQAYDIKTILSIKGKKTAMASSKSLKIVRNGDCSNVICPPLKIKQKYLIGFQTHKNSKLVLNDKYYIEEIEEKFADSNFSCRTNK